MAIEPNLSLADAPPIFIIPTNLQDDEIHDAEDAIHEASGQITYHATEARIFLGRVTQKKRCAFELRQRGVWTEEVSMLAPSSSNKRRKLGDGSPQMPSAVDTEDYSSDANEAPNVATLDSNLPSLKHHVLVLKLDWLHMSVQQDRILPYQQFLIYRARIITKPPDGVTPESSPVQSVTYIKATPETSPTKSTGSVQRSPDTATDQILMRAKADAPRSDGSRFKPRRFQKSGTRNYHRHRDAEVDDNLPLHPRLVRSTTSEMEGTGSSDMPPPPPWLKETHPRPNYACLRSTLAQTANASFIAQLEVIKAARLLTLDEIGVRAYSTAIASLSAYPHRITSAAGIDRLPGCSDKITVLWVEWEGSGSTDEERYLKVVQGLEQDEDLKHLKQFWDIWGVGADTARKFYFDFGWRDLDDVIEFGWNSSLTRVQQIGVKFYDEFQQKIPRSEVESISDVILHHARLCQDIPPAHWSNKQNEHRGNWHKPDNGRGDPAWDPRDMVVVIVGGYRRGKSACGDVDVIVSHRDEHKTKHLVIDIVRSLESAGWITHTLTLSTTTSDRDQQTLPFRARGHAGHGFDSLDKALCVWQDPHYDETAHDKNPNIHRRVDIIISPWRTIGCAVLGWSGATTFQRDIRRWVKKERGWKFDSSGVRDRGSGVVVEMEKPRKGDEGDGWEDRERRLMEGIGIGWRPGVERCTG